MTRGYFENPNEIWYCKAMPAAARARYEILGQEFYRLFIQAQSKMRLAQNFEYWSKLRSQLINSPQTVTDLNALDCDDLYLDEPDTNSCVSPIDHRYRMFSITPSSKNESSPSPLRFNRTFSNLSSFS